MVQHFCAPQLQIAHFPLWLIAVLAVWTSSHWELKERGSATEQQGWSCGAQHPGRQGLLHGGSSLPGSHPTPPGPGSGV
eukprot:15859381-Heterocapsa_arctica.AAC.1